MNTKKKIEKEIDNEIKGEKKKGFKIKFERYAAAVTKVTGSSTAFIIAALIIIIWGVTGPVFHYSDTWLLIPGQRSSLF